jgi:hypothetical protein
MNKCYDQSPRLSAAGLTTATILVMIVAMAVSVVLDAQPADQPVKATVAKTTALPKA